MRNYYVCSVRVHYKRNEQVKFFNRVASSKKIIAFSYKCRIPILQL